MNQLKNIKDWGLTITNSDPFLIAGPCSAETKEQVLMSCQGAKMAGASILRAGVWKPRTRPHAFEGVGEAALEWLKEAKEIYDLPVMIEVANARHIELAMNNGIDMFWIGARTTVNPFSVQEIADSLSGTDVPVFVKNPVNPDLELWIGAFERLNKAGISKLAGIFRGFSVSKSAPYRNMPLWDYPIELKRRIPNIEILCDPSHICGNRNMLLSVAQNAMDLLFDGLMIETHNNPSQAWSDANQQINGEELKQLMNDLVIRNEYTHDPEIMANISALRYDIDNLDAEILELMAKRMEVSREIAQYKRQANMSVFQFNRWLELFEKRMELSSEFGLSADFASELIRTIHNESIKQQSNIINDHLLGKS
ncbi:MAG: bifunctional 3-deoxy-7-phosphoheptulonate synthase/chorismate mutase type II [Saprospiraceae bacterium]|nr:bifunctional 3-deoxy-7-phosphoheptulonate synthase/chorismate mutase type II [Saprospiraceae bacterium]